MRSRFVLVAMVSVSGLCAGLVSGCGYRIDNCDLPEQPYTLNEELTARAVDRLIQQNQVIDRNNLKCEAVCESIYLDQHPRGAATTVDDCTLTLDGEFNGDPDEVVGSLECDGRGIPQFCS